MLGAVTVTILDRRSQSSPPETVLTYEVRNTGDTPIWLVDDGWLIWRQTGDQIELSFAREAMRPGATPFGYFTPKMEEIGSGDGLRRKVTLTWPLPLDRLWNRECWAAPPAGLYNVVVRIGYGLTPTIAPPAPKQDVETPVLQWQHEAVSPATELVVPEHSTESP
jgi:hypothetical protein